MPRCVICHSKFFDWTYHFPPESCDCGEQLTLRDLEDMTPEEIAAVRARWAAILAAEDGGEIV